MWSRCIILLVAAAACAEKVSYSNYKVYTVTPQTEAQVKALRSLESSNVFSFWSDVEGLGRPVNIMVAPHQKSMYEDMIRNAHFESKVMIEDVQSVIDNQTPTSRNRAFDFNDYHRVDEIYAYLDELAAKYPEVTVVTGGKSYEGREIKGIHVSFSPSNKNKTVFIEGGIHAREWIAPSTVLYLATQFLSSNDEAVTNIAKAHDWYFFPVFNPDGYEYTFDSDRLWRKTRQPHGFCAGADPNRNWGYHWMDGGASDFPCSETYGGPAEFSEPETKSMSEFIATVAKDLHAYISFHSFSQLLLIPYGHSNAHVENYPELMSIGLKAADSLSRRYGTEFTVGNIVDVIYVASGGSMDWVKGTFGTRITYTYELRDTGRYGFLLPKEQIIPVGEEVLDSMVTMLQEALKEN